MTIPNLATVNQSDNCKTIEDVRFKVLNDNTASSVINQKPKTVEMKSSKLSDRLKITPPETPLPSISNNGYTSIPSIFNVPQVRIEL